MAEKARDRGVWMVPLVMATLVAGVGWWAHRQVRHAVEQELRQDLQSTLEANVNALEIWMLDQKRTVESLAEEPRLRALALQLVADEPGWTNHGSLAEGSRQLMSSAKLPERLRTLGYEGVQVVNTNYLIVAGSRSGPRDRPGLQVPDDLQPKYGQLLALGEPVLITPFKITLPGAVRPFQRRGPPNAGQPTEGAPGPRRGFAGGAFNGTNAARLPLRQQREVALMQVAAPIKDNDGVIRGALAITINPEEFTRILSVARMGESGETFAFDPDGVMISRSRFDNQLKKIGLLEDKPEVTSALTLHLRDPGADLTAGNKPNTNAPEALIEMVASALEGGSDVTTTPFRDYRGVPVIGAWRWLPDYGLGVGAKIDETEAYATLRIVRSAFQIVFLLLVLAALVILLYTYRQAVWQKRVTEAELTVRQLGQYQLREKIGEGGMGVVYRAHHALLRRETALKLLPPDKADPRTIERFEREVRLTCQLTHPNTIQVYDYGHTPDGIFYYAMEYLDGLTLGELVARYGPQPDERVVHLLTQICDSLSEAHGLGLIHRDVKPANIFVCDRGGVADSVKVLDFGLVKQFNEVEDQSLVPVEGFVGTPNFIAPEALADPMVSDVRTDIYALGVVGYLLLTGHYVFEGKTVAEVSEKHLHETPVPPSTRVGRAICPELEAAILRCLEKDPDARPQSAAELSRVLAACPLAAEWTVERRRTWWERHRAANTVVEPATSDEPESPVAIDISERTR